MAGPNTHVIGRLVRWATSGLIGVVDAVNGKQATVTFDNGDTKQFALDAGVIELIELQPGSQVVAVNDDTNVGVLLSCSADQQEPIWQVSFPGGSILHIPERSLRPAVLRDPIERMRNLMLGRAAEFNLKSVAADLWTQHLHNDLVSLAHARVDLRPHQVAVVHRVVHHYPHRFLLCDEVGLGKTIEAAMIVKELKARKQIKRVLILVPSGLQRQWQFELKTKFNETFAIYNRDTVGYLKSQGVDHPWTHHDQIIASHTWAAWSADRREAIAAVDWDLVIVDEAHHAREQRYGRRVQRTNLYRLVRDLIARPEQRHRAALLLTATPMQLQRHELYSLVDMIDPVLFASEEDFTRHIEALSGLNAVVDRFRTHGKPQDPDEQADVIEQMAEFLEVDLGTAATLFREADANELADRLQETHRLAEVVIRNRRSTVGGFQPRTAFRWPVQPTPEERRIYELLDEVLQRGFEIADQTQSNAVGFLMATFQRLATSSMRALQRSLEKRVRKLIEGASTPTVSPTDAEELLDVDAPASDVVTAVAPEVDLDIGLMTDLIALLSRIKFDSKAITLAHRLYELFEDDPDAKVLVFTQYRETQAMLQELLQGSGWSVHLFHGQLSPIEKDRAVESFRKGTGPQILVSTEAGGEGRNFQFCHLLVNYDLPWNPMRVEQRIGRVDRIGQEHPVVVFNLFTEGTIEERILDVLEYRINLFTEAIGGLEPIIGEVEADIRKAIRLAGEAREEQLRRVAEQTEARVKAARQAEEKMRDLILDTKSFGAEIARVARGAQLPIEQGEYEVFLGKLLASANTYIDGPNPDGVYRVMFHPPFTLEHSDLIDGRERRLVCFDPRKNVDSENVEYMGFGHPIIDTLVESRIRTWVEGTTAVRQVAIGGRDGWLLNWLVTIGSVETNSFVHPVFVDVDGTVDRDFGRHLLALSRRFDREEAPFSGDLATLDTALGLATHDVSALVTKFSEDARQRAKLRADEEQARIEALHAHRKRAAQDKLAAVERTLEKLRASDRAQDQAVIPLWEANLERARVEVATVDNDRDEMLAELARRLQPVPKYELLNVARVVSGA